MLTKRQNELVTRTDAGTPLGQLMRRYWLPVALSEELAEPDGAPVRVRLLGERLVAFRDTSGRVGLLDELCAHRRASLFLGRNEECGLRCVYHGWKYDAAGQCVDMPTEPAGSRFRSRIRLSAYPTLELGGVIWTYLGPPDAQPPPPRFEWTQVPATHSLVTKTWQECNWLQALEGGIDSIHASLMHRTLTPDTARSGTRGFVVNTLPAREDVYLTDYGFYYGSIRALEGMNYVRVHQYVAPITTLFPYQLGNPSRQEKALVSGHMFVPMDDENCMVYNLAWSFDDEPLSEAMRERIEDQRGRGPGEITADYRKVRNVANDWGIDRRVQKTETYTGIDGINTQDHAIQESMGPIVDRTKEHLGATDKAVIAARQVLLRAIKTVEQGGDPPGLGTSYYRLRAIEKFLPSHLAWQETLQEELFAGAAWRGTRSLLSDPAASGDSRG
jgi:phthalate 4,5-dioxygenase